MGRLETEQFLLEQMTEDSSMWRVLLKENEELLGWFKAYPKRQDKTRLMSYVFLNKEEYKAYYLQEAIHCFMVYASGVSDHLDLFASHYPEHPKAILVLQRRGYQSELEQDKNVFPVGEQAYRKGYVILECK